MTVANSVRAVVGRGLEGNRYFFAEGAEPPAKWGPDREVTLIEAEAIEALGREYDVPLEPSESRRNIVTRGIALNHLVGREFRVGNATFRGIRLCEPCGHLESLTRPGVQKGLVHRGGLRAQIVVGGEVRVGDSIEALPTSAASA
jgi:MOSC domain-containing protein YiiM